MNEAYLLKMNEIELLQKIEQVDAPPHLLTRIHARIETKNAPSISVRWMAISYSVIGLLLIGNVLFFTNFRSTTTDNTEVETVVDDMQLNPSNQLYYD